MTENSYDNKGNLKEVEIKKDKKGFYYREGTSDLRMIRDCTKDYPTVEVKDKVIFDCGSNIGGFSRLAILGGAKQVIAYEPEKTNFDMTVMNTEDLNNIIAINSAISGSDASTLSFFMNKSNNIHCSGSINPTIKGNRVKVTIDNKNFWKELEKYKPSLIKMDIEGGEYDIFKSNLFNNWSMPDYVKEIAIEIHKPKQMDKLYAELLAIFPVVKYYEVIIMFKKPSMITAHLTRE